MKTILAVLGTLLLFVMAHTVDVLDVGLDASISNQILEAMDAEKNGSTDVMVVQHDFGVLPPVADAIWTRGPCRRMWQHSNAMVVCIYRKK